MCDDDDDDDDDADGGVRFCNLLIITHTRRERSTILGTTAREHCSKQEKKTLQRSSNRAHAPASLMKGIFKSTTTVATK